MITINGDAATPQPILLLEELIQVQSDNISIMGGLQRSKINQKKQATLNFDALSVSDYQNLISKFTTGSGLSYLNTLSDYAGGQLSFNGLPFFNEAPYEPGASLYRPFVVRIKEI